MYFTIAVHLLLTTTLPFVYTLDHPFHDRDAFQHPLEGIANPPAEPALQLQTLIGSCLPTILFCCHHLPRSYPWPGVYCGCCAERKFPALTGGLSSTELRNRELAAMQNVTTLDVFSELQPGRNETRIGLFKLNCNKGRQHIACTQTDYGFVCGCHDNWNPFDFGKKHKNGRLDNGDYNQDEGLEQENKEVPVEDVIEHRCKDGASPSEDSDVELDRHDERSYFSFQRYRRPTCATGEHWICCPYDDYPNCSCAKIGLLCPAPPDF